MIDFVSATKYKCKDSLFLGHCKPVQTFVESGLALYYLEGCERLKIFHYAAEDKVKVEGSLPYFLKGNNFTFSTSELVQAVEVIDTLLGGVGLWGALLDSFENGVIVPVEAKPKEYIARHYASEGSHLRKATNEKYLGKFVMWQQQGLDLKMYDAGANILLKQGQARREVIEGAGWNPEGNYLKWEARYTKPALLTRGVGVPLEKLQNESFLDMLKGDLMDNYHKLSPARALLPATDKKDCSSLDLALRALADALINGQGLPLQEAKRQVYAAINSTDCLSKADKDARKAQMRKALAKLQEAPESPWDLTARLEDALAIDL